jgi:serine/threonine protein kinase
MTATTSVDPGAASVPLEQDAAEALAADLVAEMTRRWRAGERPLPEEFLARHPQLWEHPEAAADLIYEELCLREEYGPDVSVEQIVDRFPQWRPQLELLIDCQQLLGPRRPAPRFPTAGESLGDFLLLAELGRGVHGRVFLASQLSLGDRPVVLKLTPCEASEHLSLARLQHTHIVPLYCVQDDASRGLRALCMPYFGGATLGQLLTALRPTSPANRNGKDLFDALDKIPAVDMIVAPARRAAHPLVINASYARTICWVGACLADALQYAHDRGLVHLDLKPSNVLLTTDGQPMVLDFHLAREPIRPDEPGPTWLGGTPGYMSPEQATALLAVRHGKPVPRPVDGRSDVYSLGVVLYEALAGSLPWPGPDLEAMTTMRADEMEPIPAAPVGQPSPLHVRNPQVSVGLSDIIDKCLADDPAQRYPTMAALAADLRRHVADRPLVGVRNRSLVERWQKWRRRRPHGLALTGMMGAVLAATGAVALGVVNFASDRVHQARTALADGRVQAAKGEWDLAAATLKRGVAAVRGLPWQADLASDLDRRLALAEEGRAAADRSAAAAELHRLADRARFLYGADRLPPTGQQELAAGCRAFWDDRQKVVDRLTPAGGKLDWAVRADLYDLAICWADLQGHVTSAAGPDDARWQSLAVLNQAEDLLGPSPVLDQERRLHGATVAPKTKSRSGEPSRAAGAARLAAPTTPPMAWEHYALGRALLRAGDVDRAATEVQQAVRLEPQGLWPNFYQGECAYRRGRPADAVAAFSVCIGAAPTAAGCYYNRALAYAALGRNDLALRDYDQALGLDKNLQSAALDKLRK